MCDRMFGKAAGTARDLLRWVTDRWEKSPWSAEQIDWGKLDPPAYRDTWPPEVVAKMTQLWEKARRELKDDPAALQRFLYVTSSLESFPVEIQAQAGAKPDRQ